MSGELRGLRVLWLGLALCGLAPAGAQTVAAPEPAASAASAPEAAASAPSAEPAPELPSCAAVTTRAMAADGRIVQSPPNTPLAALVQLQEQALAQWRLAVQRCDGRARERAQRLLQDNERARARLAEREQAGVQCELSGHDAQSLGELAKAAFAQRRWADAGELYRKVETLWDLAAEHCTGELQRLAEKRRAEAEIDGHNAELCAPGFERAREATTRHRALGGSGQPAERERASQLAETLWRDATESCKGQAQELARNNSEAMARERGTPWLRTQPDAQAAAPAAALPQRSGFATVAAPAPPPPAPSAAASAPPEGAAPGATVVAGVAATATAPVAPGLLARAGAAVQQLAQAATRAPAAAPSAPAATAVPAATAEAGLAAPPAPTESVELRATDTRYIGRFALDAQRRISGEGRVEWTHGDVYEGPLVEGRRQGKGRLRWASGQQYEGDWVDDAPQGQGELRFASGDVYMGGVQAGSPHGQGEMRFAASGDSYRGSFEMGKLRGQGLYRWANGQSFEGQWDGFVPQGPGVLRFANGNHYEGPVRDGVPEGRGRMKYADGSQFDGDFKAGLPHGQGRYVWAGGGKYEGQWQAGKKHGQGTFTFASGERWVGRFEDDERSDDGVFHGK